MSTFKVPRRLTVLSILAVIGFAASVYLTQHFYEVRNGVAGFKSLCNVADTMNCDAIAASRFAEFFLGIPLSSFSAGWFVALFLVSLFLRDRDWRRDALRVALVLTGIGTVFSVVYFGIMAGVLHTYCLFCLVIDAVNLAALGIVLSLKPEGLKTRALDREKTKTLGYVCLASLLGIVAIFTIINVNKVDQSALNGAIQSVLSSPQVSVASGPEFPSVGAGPDAPITIVEFSDYQCPYCKNGAYILNSVMNRYPGKVRVVFRNFPLDPNCNRFAPRGMHAHACAAAKISYCAHQQGKFAPVYEALFENQHSLTAAKALEYAKEAGADEAQLKACVDAPATASRITSDIEEGNVLNVQSTPTFFINGRKVEGAYPVPVWVGVIDRLLAEKK